MSAFKFIYHETFDTRTGNLPETELDDRIRKLLRNNAYHVVLKM